MSCYICIGRAAKKYDSYGFEIEGWSEDVMVQAAGLQSKSEQLVATIHEVRTTFMLIYT